MSAYTTPSLFGGNKNMMLATLIFQQAKQLANWTNTGMISLIMIVISLGLLDENFIAIHMSGLDISLLKEKGASVVSFTGANMKSGKGIPRLHEMMNQGIHAGIGIDGPISGDTLELMSVMKLTAISQKSHYTSRDILSSQEILRMATHTNALILGFDNLGMIKEGYKVDFLLLRKMM